MIRIRLTGISTPFGGLAWEYVESEAKVATRLVNFLEDRRIVKGRLGHAPQNIAEQREYAVKSILQIRARIGEELDRVRRKSKLAQSMRAMQKACREFLEAPKSEESQYVVALDRLCSVFAEQMLRIGTTYGFSIESDVDDFGEQEGLWRESYVRSWGAGTLKLVPREGEPEA